MHLAIVSPYPPHITGIGQYGYHVSQLLAQSGLFSRITVLTGGYASAPRPALTDPVQVEYTWQPGEFDVGRKITRQLDRIQPDLAWFNLGVSIFGRSPLANLSGFLSLVQLRCLKRIPTIVTLHELPELADLRALDAPGGPLAVAGARLLTRIALQTDVACLTMRRYVDWLAAHPTGPQCMHIPIGAYHRPEMLPESRARELLFFTTLAPYKGLETLLEAFATLRRRYPDLGLTIAGAQHVRFPHYARELREKFGQLAGVRWLGQVTEQRVRELFCDAQIVVLPYNASTGSSSVLYQAATWGRPIVASDLPETRAAARESDIQLTYFERGNATSLAEALHEQLGSTAARRRQAQHNFSTMQRHPPEETCQAYLQAFNLALEARRSPKRIDIPTRFTPEPV